MATIRKRGERYQVQVRRQGSHSVSKSFLTLKDAQQWARHIEIQIDRNELPHSGRRSLEGLTLGSLIVRYRDEITPRKKGADTEAIVLNAMLRHEPLSQTPLASLSRASFVSYRDERLSTVSPSTVRRQLAILSHVLTVAMDEWRIPLRANPLVGMSIPGLIDNRRTRRLSADEEQRILEGASKLSNPSVRRAILFALHTGMRRGEILNARREHLQAQGRLLLIPDTKTGTPRTIPLSESARALVMPSSCTGAEKLFPTTANALRLAWGRLMKRLGIEDLHFHDLRHEAISRFFEKGLNVPEVAMMSGHKDARMLYRYTHPNPLLVLTKLEGKT